MSYGIQLINQFGENTLASDGLLFEHSTGSLVNDIGAGFLSGGRKYGQVNNY